MKSQKDWQIAWHRVLDEELGVDPKAPSVEELPEPDCDFRLNFETWDLSEAGLRRCFGMLPRGEALAERAVAMRSRLRSDLQEILSEEDALALVRKGIADLSAYVTTDWGPLDEIRLLRGSGEDLGKVFASADVLTIELDDGFSDLVEEHAGPLGREAYYFVSETLYRLASDYAIAHWIAWPLCHKGAERDPYESFAALAVQDCFPGLDKDGVFLFVSQ